MRGYRIFLCGIGGPIEIPNPECVNAERHTPRPRGYLERIEWAEKMARTHTQQECPACGRWVIWVKQPGEAREAPADDRS